MGHCLPLKSAVIHGEMNNMHDHHFDVRYNVKFQMFSKSTRSGIIYLTALFS